MNSLTTLQMLAMQYGFKPLIPLEQVAKDYLSDISKTELHRQASEQKLGFACVNTCSNKRPKYYVPIESLAFWIDSIKNNAISDHKAMK